MTRNFRLLASASALAGAAFAATPAFAEGTLAGETISNTVTLNYEVGGVEQTEETDSDSFVVDRKVNLLVAEVGSATTGVVPGEAGAVTAFTVTNTTNAAIDIELAVTQLSGGTTAHGGTDAFDIDDLVIFVDQDADNEYDAGEEVTYLDEVDPDETITVLVSGDVPLSLANEVVAGIRLSGTAREAGAAATLGAALTETTGVNTAGVDTVFADTDDDGNTARDAISFDEDDYTVSAAALTVTKTSTVIEDPLNGATDPKMIPGATVEYCIAVSNAAGGATATGINISDDLDEALVTIVDDSIFVDATVSGTDCSGGTLGGAYDGDVLTATLSDIDGGEALGVRFQVTID